MLITKTVKVKWNPKTKKYYEALGYKFTNYGDEFEVKIEDLTKGSGIEVDCICDNCKCNMHIKYNNYNNRTIKENGKTYCNQCANKLYAKKNMQKTKLKNSKSFFGIDGRKKAESQFLINTLLSRLGSL